MRKRTILFVDDEEMSRKYFRRIFRGDFEVILASDGQEGLDIFRERREEIGIVVTDQIMPRMTGLNLLAAIEKEGPELIRILSTAYADSELVAEAAKSQMIDYFVVKPWDIERVSAILAEAADHFARGREESPDEGEAKIADDLKTLI